MTTILLIEDNERLRGLMAIHLRRAGYTVLEAGDGEKGLAAMERTAVSLLIVDLMMPVMDGFTFIETLRGVRNPVPILVVTAKETLDDKRRGFGLGADDYLVKPIDMEEMLLHVEALLRRSAIAQGQTLTVGSTTLDESSLTATCAGVITVLPQKEFFLLQTLLSYPAKIFTRQALMDGIWGYDNESDPRTVDVHIRRLREKFETSDDFTIETVRGLGYRAVLK